MNTTTITQLPTDFTIALNKMKEKFPADYKEHLVVFIDAIENENRKTRESILNSTISLIEKSTNNTTVIGLMAACKYLLDTQPIDLNF